MLDGSPDITTGGGLLGDPSGDEGPDVEGPVEVGYGDAEMTLVGVGIGVDGGDGVGPAADPDVALADAGAEL